MSAGVWLFSLGLEGVLAALTVRAAATSPLVMESDKSLGVEVGEDSTAERFPSSEASDAAGLEPARLVSMPLGETDGEAAFSEGAFLD